MPSRGMNDTPKRRTVRRGLLEIPGQLGPPGALSLSDQGDLQCCHPAGT